MKKMNGWVFGVSLILAGTIHGETNTSVPVSKMNWSLAVALDRIKVDPSQAENRKEFLYGARRIAAKPIVQRVYKLEDVGKKGRTSLDGRAWISPENTREAFALAMSDHRTCMALRTELPPLAAAYRLTGDRVFLDRLVAQLEEAATWSPLQRPGWTLYHERAKPLGPKGDGNWLATGLGVLGIVEALEILPPNSLSLALRTKLDTLLKKEVESCLDDWKLKRPWFYNPPNPFTNQWVLPTAGYLLACLQLGREAHGEGYELGVAHLKMSLDAYGDEGAFVEGLSYSSATVEVLLSTARILALAGDDRLITHPFLKHYPSWVVQHYQPGGSFINSFDAFGAVVKPLANGKRRSEFREVLSLCAISTVNPDAVWALRHLEDGGMDLRSLLSASLQPAPGYTPPLWAVYDKARRVNWRSSWQEDATGVWVRGGHPSDQHDHADRGHVNYVLQGKPLLIEAGTPAYHNPRMASDYTSGRGHNVLQVGSQLPMPGTVAPIAVRRLDDKGGDVWVDAARSFKNGVQRWDRHVQWDAGRLIVNDIVEITAPEFLLFRWHLGTSEKPVIRAIDKGFAISWSDADMRLESETPFEVVVEPMPDHTLRQRQWETPDIDAWHTCLVVKSKKPETKAGMSMTIEGREM